jgi:hypothetical protein
MVRVAGADVDNYGVVSAVLVGGDWFVGNGLMVELFSPWAKNAGVLFAIFIGIDGFLGNGGVVLRGSPFALNLGLPYTNPNATLYHINGEPFTPPYPDFKVFNGEVRPLDRRRLSPAVRAVRPPWLGITSPLDSPPPSSISSRRRTRRPSRCSAAATPSTTASPASWCRPSATRLCPLATSP